MNRHNSYSEDEYFKTVVVAHSQEQAQKLAFWLTGAEVVWRENFYKSKTGNFLAYCRWFNNPDNLPTTVYADAMLVYLESAEQFNDLSGYLNSHRGIVNKLFISDSQDFSQQASSLKGRWLQKPNSAEQLQQNLLEFDNQFINNAERIFKEIDVNNNGFISENEVDSLVTQLGETLNEKDIANLKHVSGTTYKGISFQNFLIWWKLGRQDSHALQFLVKIDQLSHQMVTHGRQMFEGMKEKLSNVVNEQDNLSNQNVRLFSGNVSENPGFELLLDLCLGNEKTEACVNYLKQWTSNFNSATGIFLDFDFKFDESVSGSEVKRILDDRVAMLRGFLAMVPDLNNVFNTFIIVETYGNQNSGKLTFRLKVDAEALFRKHLSNIFYVLENLFHGVSQHFHFDFRTQSSIKEVFSNNLNGFNVLKNFEADFNIRLMREHLRVLSNNIPRDMKQLLYVLTSPSDVDIKIRLDMERALGPAFTPLLQIPLGEAKNLLKMLPLDYVFGEDIGTMRKLKEVQVGLNSYFFFTRFKLHVEGILDE